VYIVMEPININQCDSQTEPRRQGPNWLHPIDTEKDYGRPIKPFFIEVQNFWDGADKLDRYILEHLGYFLPIYQHPFWYSEIFIIHPLFLQKNKP
jgi:hypothetical protein